jgi:hypothetical protein
MGTTAMLDGARDFDFWMGRWKVKNRRLVRRLAGCTEWETFDASSHARALPAGIGNFDDFVPDGWRPGFVGMTLRVFNPQTRQWSIYWLDNDTGGIDSATGQLRPPVVGGFVDGVGTFVGRDTFEGRPILVKFVWSGIRADAARWHQEFSADDGRTWETNWIMEMTRAAPL